MVRKSEPQVESPPRHVVRNLVWVLLAGTWLLVAAAMISYDRADWPSHFIAPHNAQAHNWIGAFGALVAHKVYLMIGPGAWVLIAGTAVGLAITTTGRWISEPVLRAIGLLIMSIATSSMIALAAPRGLPLLSLEGGRPEGSGGLLALIINDQLRQRFNAPGTMLILTVAVCVGAVLAADRLVLAVPRLLGRFAGVACRVPLPWPLPVGKFPSFALFGRSNALAGPAPVAVPHASAASARRGRQEADRGKGLSIDDGAGGIGATEYFDPDNMDHCPGRSTEERNASDDRDAEEDPFPEDDSDENMDDDRDDGHDASGANGTELSGTGTFTEEELRAKIKKLPINFAAVTHGKSKAPPAFGIGINRDVDLSGYRFPDLSLLEEPESNFTIEQERVVRDQAVSLESALQEYRIEGEVVGIDSGPVITLYEVRLAPGTKVSRITAVSSDLARALKAQNIRVVANMVGKDTVGIEVPNTKKEKVRLKELMTAFPEAPHQMKLPMWIAKDASGNPLVADLAMMPHMLIAGTTGSGKSVCVNAIIMSFLYTKRPDELKLVLVDPKMVEMSMFKEIPHLMCPVVTEMAKATAILEWATTKMDERYELLAEAGVRDVAAYNRLSWEQLKERFNPQTESEEARIPKKLPYIVFIIDELADLIITAKEVEGFIVRLAQKARAIGIHLILATQRPQANVVTGLIKGNMPCRISFKVASGLDSRIVLDQKGAELLLGQGDMLYLSPRTSKLLRAQGTLVEDQEIRETVRFLKQVALPSFEPQLVQLKTQDIDAGEDKRDPAFDEAVRIVLESRRGSVSLIQRRLAVGYSRASRLIEQMAVAGIIGDYKGSQAREVTMTLEEYEALLAQAEADAKAGTQEIDATDPELAIDEEYDSESDEEDKSNEQWEYEDDGDEEEEEP